MGLPVNTDGGLIANGMSRSGRRGCGRSTRWCCRCVGRLETGRSLQAASCRLHPPVRVAGHRAVSHPDPVSTDTVPRTTVFETDWAG